MKTTILFMLILSSSLGFAQSEESGEQPDIGQIKIGLEVKCKDKGGKFRFENLSEKIGERPHSVCYRYACDVPVLSKKSLSSEGNSIALNDVQVLCHDNEIPLAIVHDLRQWGKEVPDAVASPKRGVSSAAQKH